MSYRVASQVGAAAEALSGSGDESRQFQRGPEGGQVVQCTSLKSNMGHLEACAAAAGLISLVATPLMAGTVSANAQVRRSVVRELGARRWGIDETRRALDAGCGSAPPSSIAGRGWKQWELTLHAG